MEIWGHCVLGKTWESEISAHIPGSSDEDEGRHNALETDFGLRCTYSATLHSSSFILFKAE